MLRFVNEQGDFQVKHPNEVSYTYFPLCNDYGMKNSITHSLNGDMKANQHQFMLAPVSQEDLQNSSFGRNFWIKYKDKNPISVVGNSAIQKTKENLNMTLDAGLLWHQVSLEEDNLESKVISYVPNIEGYIEVSKVTLKNKEIVPLTFRPTLVVPHY